MKILNKSILAMTITSFSMAAIAVGGATFVVASAADETHSISVVKDDVVDDRVDSEPERAATNALEQIERNQYVTAMKREGITLFFKIGVSFYKKHVKLMSESE